MKKFYYFDTRWYQLSSSDAATVEADEEALEERTSPKDTKKIVSSILTTYPALPCPVLPCPELKWLP
jgi:hypothetical protein